jgi:hypothetical protein
LIKQTSEGGRGGLAIFLGFFPSQIDHWSFPPFLLDCFKNPLGKIAIYYILVRQGED